MTALKKKSISLWKTKPNALICSWVTKLARVFHGPVHHQATTLRWAMRPVPVFPGPAHPWLAKYQWATKPEPAFLGPAQLCAPRRQWATRLKPSFRAYSSRLGKAILKLVTPQAHVFRGPVHH